MLTMNGLNSFTVLTIELYSFFIAAVTHYHKFRTLKQHNFIILRVLEVRGLTWFRWAKLKVSARLDSFLGALGMIPFSCLFSFKMSPTFSVSLQSQ